MEFHHLNSKIICTQGQANMKAFCRFGKKVYSLLILAPTILAINMFTHCTQKLHNFGP